MNSAMAVAAGPVSERRLGTIGNEDWWAVIVGLAIVIAGLIDYALGTGVIKFLGVSPAGMKWASGGDIVVHFARLWPNYLAQFVVLTIVFGGSLRLMGRPFGEFLPSFALIYIGLLFVSTLAGWKDANYYNLEAALLALIGGLALANAVKIPERLKAALRVEFYVKTGIVLLGATFPISLIVSAGGVALTQSAIISILTAAIIFFVATRVFGLDRRFAAVLGT
ncbi:MAG: putative sulfate exporter family transporter, partial [Xanthobacteraceae bacterium]